MGKGKGEEKGAGERLLWSNGRMMQCADDVLLETCMVLQTNVTLINSIIIFSSI